MEWEMDNNNNSINNKSVQRKRRFTHRGVQQLDSVLCGCWDKDMMASPLNSGIAYPRAQDNKKQG